MYNISHKYKQLLFLLLKVVIIAVAFYFMYYKLATNKLLSLELLKQQLSIAFSNSIWAIIILLLFTDANWLLEIFKWKILASYEKKITFLEAYKQCFASLTISIITPNKIGEYGAKALYFEKKRRKRIVFLNALGNLSQLLVTLIFGLIGIVFFSTKFSVVFPVLNTQKLFYGVGLFLLLFLFRKKIGWDVFLKMYVKKALHYLKKMPASIHFKILGFSFLRYLFFSHQFYFLLLLFQVNIAYFTAMPLLFFMYFIVSIIPNLAIFDWVIKGSVAVWIFSFVKLNALTVLSITTIMWILNFAIPALLGSVFVLNFKLNKTI